MSGMAFHHGPWKNHIVRRRRVWHARIASGHHTLLEDVGRGMQSYPLDSTHGRTTLVLACYHHSCTAQTNERC